MTAGSTGPVSGMNRYGRELAATYTAGSPPVAAPAHRAVEVAQREQDQADDEQDDADGEQDGQLGHEQADAQQDDAEDDHGGLPPGGLLAPGSATDAAGRPSRTSRVRSPSGAVASGGPKYGITCMWDQPAAPVRPG